MADDIISHNKPSSPSPLDPPSRIVCHVCEKQFSQYTCPRCNSRYCSLHCYKSHSLRCTESFMRENVVEELQHLKPNDETKGKMLDILKRFHSEEETEDMNEEGLTLSEQTIQKFISVGQLTFDDLSLEEKKIFQRAIASGELSRMIEPWDPWWTTPSARTITLSREGAQLVQIVPEREDSASPKFESQGNQESQIPHGPENPLPPLSQLSSAEPSPLLTLHLVDIIYSYCFTLRLYNGDWRSDPGGSASVALSISSVLGRSENPDTLMEALSHCLQQTCSPTYKHTGGLQFGLGLVEDTANLLTLGRGALLCLLSDLRRLIQAGIKELKWEKPLNLGSHGVKNKLKLAERKIYYVMCWVNEQPGEAWSSLAALVRAEKASALEYSRVCVSTKAQKNAESTNKVLIEEIE